MQSNHLHLICEAKSSAALSRGIKRFKQRVARRINKPIQRKGSVFVDRYHMVIARTPRQVRNTLCYVLQNLRRHGATPPAWAHGVDPYSSAWWFDGWRDDTWRNGLSPPPDGQPCVSPAGTWLLATGWRRHGLLGIGEAPPAAQLDGL